MNIIKLCQIFNKYALKYSTKDAKEDWDKYALDDPYFYILRNPDKKDKWTEKEFYGSGKTHVQQVLDFADEFGLARNKSLAIDFGCGAGRLTEWLAKEFKKTIGIDASTEMLKLAKAHAEYKNIKNINYIETFSSIKPNSADLIFSLLTLEHVPPEQSKKIIKEFCVALKKNGLCVFDLPYESPKNQNKFNEKMLKQREKNHSPVTLMYSVPQNEVFEIIYENDCHLVKIIQSKESAGENFPANFYYISK